MTGGENAKVTNPLQLESDKQNKEKEFGKMYYGSFSINKLASLEAMLVQNSANPPTDRPKGVKV